MDAHCYSFITTFVMYLSFFTFLIQVPAGTSSENPSKEGFLTL